MRDFVVDVLSSEAARIAGSSTTRKVLAKLDPEPRFGRKIWGLLCLELWQRSSTTGRASFRDEPTEALA